jgi:hypothetical protein
MSKRAHNRRRRERWYIASYIQRIDPVPAFKQSAKHKPWAVWENRILVRAFNSEDALRRAMKLFSRDHNYKNPDGVLLRSKVEGLTSLVRVLEEPADGAEIEWFDHTGETVMAMKKRLRKKPQLEAFRAPHDWQAEPSAAANPHRGSGSGS